MQSVYSCIPIYSHQSTSDLGSRTSLGGRVVLYLECFSLSFKGFIPKGSGCSNGCLPKKVPHGAHLALLQEELDGDGGVERVQPGIQCSVLHHGSEPGDRLLRPLAPLRRSHLRGGGGGDADRQPPCSVTINFPPRHRKRR